MRNHLAEYLNDVAEAIAELGGYPEAEALKMAGERKRDVEYGSRYRIAPSLVAGSILGINDCCLAGRPETRQDPILAALEDA